MKYKIFSTAFLLLAILLFTCCGNQESEELKLINEDTNVELPPYIIKIGVQTEYFDSDFRRNYAYKVPELKILEFRRMIDSIIELPNSAGVWRKTENYYNFISNKKNPSHYFEIEFSLGTRVLIVTEILL